MTVPHCRQIPFQSLVLQSLMASPDLVFPRIRRYSISPLLTGVMPAFNIPATLFTFKPLFHLALVRCLPFRLLLNQYFSIVVGPFLYSFEGLEDMGNYSRVEFFLVCQQGYQINWDLVSGQGIWSSDAVSPYPVLID